MSFDIPNYSLLKRLGEGAMAEVWLAEHRRNGRKAAIKILKPAAVADSDFEKLFLREGQVLASFDHPNIVRIYDNDRVGDLAYLVMEHLPGGTLAERMQRRPITIGEALGLVAQIAAALDAAHRQQVIHRDLKPANIMLRDETTPVLTDFGAVRLLDRSTIYGRDGMIVGTPIYMSPEQLQGLTLSGSSDLYALGVLFFELLTGDRPFPGVSFAEIAAQHLYAPIPRLPAAISMLQPVLDRLLAKQSEDRYQHAQTVVDDLRAIFIHDEALRQQVGFAATSAAWSTQLRALGFVLDRDQKAEVRVAQGEFLREQAIPADQSAGRAPTGSAAAEGTTRLRGEAAANLAGTQPADGAPARTGPSRGVLAASGLVVAAVIGGGWWWSQRDPTGPRPGIESQVLVVAPDITPPELPGAASDDAPRPTDNAAGEDATAATMPEPSEDTMALHDGYAMLDDGAVLDINTGLAWAATDNGADIDWSDARRYCEAMGAGWQLPSPSDLISLYDASGTITRACGESICKVTPLLLVTAGFHWTRMQDNDTRTWVVDLSNGARQSMAAINPFHIRALCVRGPVAHQRKD